MSGNARPIGAKDLMDSGSSGSVVADVQIPSRTSGLFGFFSKTLGTSSSRASPEPAVQRGRIGSATEWDLNEDSRLDRDELKAMARADGTRYDRYMAADLDGDGMLESEELRVAEEAEDQHNRVHVLHRVKDAYKRNVRKVSSYWTLMSFSAFLVIYLWLLYKQADVDAAYGMASTVTNALVPTNPETDDDQRVYADKSEVFGWLKDTFGPIWADPKCGNGECEQMEFPGFGRFGCTADCGAYPHLTKVDVEIAPIYTLQNDTDGVDAARAEFLAETKWNLCTKELRPERGEECWFETDRHVSNYVGTVDTWRLEVPGMNWYVRLLAPFGGVAGKVFVTDPNTGRKEVKYTWGYCQLDVDKAIETTDGYRYDMYVAAGVIPAPTPSRKLLIHPGGSHPAPTPAPTPVSDPRATRVTDASPPAKPQCASGFRLLEALTQASLKGDQNEWVVKHVVFDDAAIAAAGIDTSTVNATAFSAHVTSETVTAMVSGSLSAFETKIDQWCVKPGNYSLVMSDSNARNFGWRGGAVFMTGADECEIVSAFADGVTSETIYFTIPDVSDGDIAGRDCAAAGLERRDYENGWCTFDVATSAATCNPRSDARSPILPTSTDIQKRCYLGVCQNPRCHEPMLLADYRSAGDGANGCCNLVQYDTPFAMETVAVPPPPGATPPVPLDTSVRKRYVSSKNVIVGGVLLYQTRSGNEPCKGKFGDARADRGLSGETCPVVDKSDVDPYGVDPVFISTSRLYDPEAKDKMCCRPESAAQGGSNASDPGSSKFYKSSELNVKGVPYGFYPSTLTGREDGFAVVIDINLRENAFDKLIEYLEDGFFIDKYTKNLKVEVLTYNGELRYFCNLVVDFDFSQGGNIQVEYSADSAATQPYYHDPNDEAEVNSYNFRRLLEAVFCLFVISAMCTELTELVGTTLKTGHPMDYFVSVWNYIEVLSIMLHMCCVGMWLWQVAEMRAFDTEPRFNVYLDTQHARSARLLEFRDDGSQLKQYVVDVLGKFNSVIEVQVLYGTFNGINIFLCLLRFFKAADFQPKLGIVTRTIGKSFQELAHFFALLGIVCLMYTFLGQVVFGSKLLQFSTLAQAGQTIISWTLSGDDRGVGEELFDLPGRLAVAGALFYMTFSFITTLMLLNFLIAILSEGYMKVQEESADTESIISEMSKLSTRWLRAKTSRGKLLTDRAALKRVRAMLAAEEFERDRFMEKHGIANTAVRRRGRATRDDGDSDSDEEGRDSSSAKVLEFSGDQGRGVEVTELRRVLEGSYQTARRANGSGLKKAKGGLGDVAVLCESIVASVGNAKSVDDTSPMEKKVNEMHSVVLMIAKQLDAQQRALQEQQRALSEQQASLNQLLED